MQNQFKPGDLVVIVGSSTKGSPNIGRCAEIAFMVKADEEFTRPNGEKAIARLPEGVRCAWLVVADGLHVHRKNIGQWVMTGYSLQLDQQIIPLKSTETPQLEKQKEVEHG